MKRPVARHPIGWPLLLATVALAGRAAASPTPLAWEMVSHRTPRVFWAGRNHDVRLRVRNAGTATWSEEAGDHLSYHWLAPDGKVIEHDGMRARFAAPVKPGETAEIVARVHAPEQTGKWLLEWEMVREQVAWFGPPAGGARLRLPVRVMWRCGLLQLGFGLLSLAGVFALRRWRPRPDSWRWTLVELGPVIWTWLGVLLLTATFSEVVGRQLWRGGGVLAASAAALLALPVALLPGRWRSWAGPALVVVPTALAFADVIYLRFFDTVVPLVAISAMRQLGQIEGSVQALWRPADAWLAPSLVGAVVVALLWPRASRDEEPPRRARLAAWGVGVLACLVAAVPALWTLRTGLRNPATADQLFSKPMLLGRWGLINVHLFDLLRTWREWTGGDAPNPAEVARVRRFFAERAAASAGAAERCGVAKGASLVLVQVESLQQWVVGVRVRGAEITPFLNSLRSRALYFPCVFDQSGQGRSSDAEFAVLNSQHALDRGAVAFRRPRNHFVALPEVLREHGYATLSAHPFEKGFWNRGVLHPRWGFEHMLFKDEMGPGEVIGWGLADAVFFDRMADQLRLRPQPYFAFLITLGLHHPFDKFPARHEVLDVGELAGTPLGNYIHAMHYFDASLAAFVDEMQREGMLANTVLALYGDHEAGLAVDDNMLRVLGEKSRESSILVRVQRVPFFVLLPGQKLTGEIAAVGGHVDIAPTLLALLGIAPPPVFVGHPLVPGAPSFAVLNDGSAVGSDRMFVAKGPLIPPDGSCFTWPGGGPRPLAECRDLQRRGEEELTASRLVVARDLAGEISASSPP